MAKEPKSRPGGVAPKKSAAPGKSGAAGKWPAKRAGSAKRAASPRPSKRRKDERPAEIVEAALEEFAQKGFAQARLEDVAARAGVSKGLPYLYFKTKEELFKAVLKTFIKPGFDALIAQVHESDLPPDEFLRGPFLDFVKEFAKSRRALIVRLMVAEGHKHPELTRFHMENVVEPGIAAMQQLIDRGVNSGAFRPTALRDFPQLLIAPVLMSMIWRILFERHRHLDIDGMLETHIELILAAIGAEKDR